MGKTQFIHLLLIVIVLLTNHVEAQRISMAEAVTLALQNNERIKQYEERRLQKKYQKLEAWGNFLPTVSLYGSYNHMNKELSIDLSPIRNAIIQLQVSDQVQLANLASIVSTGVPLSSAQQGTVMTAATTILEAKLPPFVEKLKDQTYKSASVMVVQPLFVGGKLLAAKRYASAELHASEIEYEAVRNEVIQQAITSYLAVVFLTDVVRTRHAVCEAMVRHKQQAYRLLEEGLLAYHQVLRADVAVAEAERQLLDDESKRTLAVVALRHTLGLPEDEPLEVTDSLTFLPMGDTLSYFLQAAERNHPLLKTLKEKKEAAQAGYFNELAEFLPHVAAFGKHELYPHDLSLLEPRWIVGVQMSLNIFQGMKKYTRLERAVHQEREVEYIEADAQRKINFFVRKKYFDFQNSKTRYEKLQRNLALAIENLRFVTARFATGMASSLDVIDAQLVVEKNEVESKESLYQYYAALTELYTAIGNPQEIVTLLMKEK